VHRVVGGLGGIQKGEGRNCEKMRLKSKAERNVKESSGCFSPGSPCEFLGFLLPSHIL